MRRAAIVITLALCAAGCGARARDAVKPDAVACPAGTEPLNAREVIGPVSRRFEVLPPERPKPIEQFVAGLRREMRPAYPNPQTRVIYPRGQLQGTVMIVV